jgi:hypothetical protein
MNMVKNIETTKNNTDALLMAFQNLRNSTQNLSAKYIIHPLNIRHIALNILKVTFLTFLRK